MKNLKYFALATVALLTGLSSCSNNEMDDVNEKELAKNVYLKLTSELTTYSESTPMATDTEIKLNEGTIYFTNAIGIIKNIKQFGESKEIKLKDMKTGQTFTNIDGSVSNVYVLGNTTHTAEVNNNIKLVKDAMLAVASQKDINNVNLWGENKLEIKTEGTEDSNAVYTTTVNLKPTVARIEISDIKGGGDIVSFKVEAIFVDGFYKQATIPGVIDKVDLKALASKAGELSAEVAPYNADTAAGAIFDTVDKDSEESIVKPTNTVWAYNLFAPQTGQYTPNIVIKLTDVVVKDGESSTQKLDKPQFITIKGFKSGDDATSINAGKVYNIAAGALFFDQTKITPEPNTKAIDVEVIVTIPNWHLVPVTPDI